MQRVARKPVAMQKKVARKRVVGGKKAEPKPVRIMVFGTFDILHPGHLHFFKQARALAKNPYLIVSIARDVNVKRIKGKLPLHNERQRAALVKYSGLVDKVVLGDVQGYLRHIKKQQPAIIALGYDQLSYYVDSTAKFLQESRSDIMLVRLKPFQPKKYKSSIFKNRFRKGGG